MGNDGTKYMAMVSGTAEVALLYPLGSDPKNDQPTHIIDWNDEETVDLGLLADREIRMRNLHQITDWELIAADTLAEIRTKLAAVCDAQCVLYLLPTVFDPERDQDLLKAIEGYLNSPGVEARVREPFLSIPFPKETNWEHALQAAEQAGTEKTLALLREMQEAHAPMQHNYCALLRVLKLVFGEDLPVGCRDIFACPDTKNAFIHLMARHDVFHRLGQGEDFDTVLAEVDKEDMKRHDFGYVARLWKQALAEPQGEDD